LLGFSSVSLYKTKHYYNTKPTALHWVLFLFSQLKVGRLCVAGISSYDKEVMKRIEDIDKLDPATKEHLFFLVDNIIQNFKTKQAFAK